MKWRTVTTLSMFPKHAAQWTDSRWKQPTTSVYLHHLTEHSKKVVKIYIKSTNRPQKAPYDSFWAVRRFIILRLTFVPDVWFLWAGFATILFYSGMNIELGCIRNEASDGQGKRVKRHRNRRDHAPGEAGSGMQFLCIIEADTITKIRFSSYYDDGEIICNQPTCLHVDAAETDRSKC